MFFEHTQHVNHLSFGHDTYMKNIRLDKKRIKKNNSIYIIILKSYWPNKLVAWNFYLKIFNWKIKKQKWFLSAKRNASVPINWRFSNGVILGFALSVGNLHNWQFLLILIAIVKTNIHGQSEINMNRTEKWK
jgi:hypothetical protein